MNVKKINFFQNIDEKMTNFFGQVSQNNLTKLNDYIENNTTENGKKIIHLMSAIIISILPLIIVLIFYISNKQLSNENAAISKIIANVLRLETDESSIDSKLKSLMTMKDFLSPKDFAQYIYQKVRASDVAFNDILMENVEIIETIGDVNVLKIEGKVKSLGTKEISQILLIIDETNPININEIEITQNKTNNLLDIKFSFEARVKK